MKAPVAAKIPNFALAAKNSTSGPMSSTSLRMGLSFFLSGIIFVISGIQPNDGAGEIARGEGREVIDAFADANVMHRQAESRGDRNQDAAARGAVELCHHQPRHTRDLAEDVDLAE